MNFEELSRELQERIKACSSAEELKVLAEAEGFALTDEMLQGVAGGEGGEQFCRGWSCTEDICMQVIA